MPVIILKFKENEISKHALKKGKPLTIGRRKSNDIVVENLAVSGHHAKIDTVGDGYVLTDLQSKNGSFVNEQLVASHWLENGDVINIGKHTLEFSYQEGESPLKDSSKTMDKTMLMDTPRHRSMVSKSAAKAGSPTPSAPPVKSTATRQQPVGVLSYLAGGDGEISITKKLMKIGKDPSSDIVVNGFGVKATAATISMRPDGYYLSHVGGLTKTKVNGDAVKDSVPLKEFDIIELGSVKVQFFTKD
jgi:pSer/pThr/pTyr-binding forkhead associated (FHA) protein